MLKKTLGILWLTFLLGVCAFTSLYAQHTHTIVNESDIPIEVSELKYFGLFNPNISDSCFQNLVLDDNHKNYHRYEVVLTNPKEYALDFYISINSNLGSGYYYSKVNPSTSFTSFNSIDILANKEGHYYPSLKYNLNAGQRDTLVFYYRSITYDERGIYQLEILDETRIKNQKSNILYSSSFLVFALFSFLALLSFQLIYIFIQWYINRGSEYVFYIAYLICVLLYFFLKAEVIIKLPFLIYSFGEWFLDISNVLLFIPYIFYLKFARHFLEMPTLHPHINRQIIKAEYGILLLSILFVLCEIWMPNYASRIFLLSVSIVVFIYTLYLIAYFFKNRTRLTNFFLIGSLCAATGHFLAMTLSSLPSAIYWVPVAPIVFTMLGLSFEVLFFNTGLGYKAKHDQDEKVRTQTLLIEELKRTEMLKEEIQNTRDQIARDLHDDVGASLSSIRIYCNLALKNFESKMKNVRDYIEYINKSSINTMEHMSDIVWAINPRNDSIEDIVFRLKNDANEILSVQDIETSFIVDENVKTVSFSMELRKDIYLAIKECITNQAKYSKATRSEINIEIDQDQLKVFVYDNGVGFNKQDIIKGNGLKNIETRVSRNNGTCEINSTPGNGTYIIMIWPINKTI
ncbi:MAG TPA: 7TM diverse intracellular signaling domain-containing protein [Bacteroidia bacterium]|nr:7TM diverse intracellular signaling domain-containing protein [Bacteroidia bacterium]